MSADPTTRPRGSVNFIAPALRGGSVNVIAPALRGGATIRAAAFTLVELMISLTIGGIAITSIYAVGAASTRQFHQQQQIASAQSALRIAMNQVKRDISRAGYLGTPNANAPAGFVPQSCAPVVAPLSAPLAGGSLAAISNYQDDVVIDGPSNNSAVDPTGLNRANGFTVDSIVLIANYETSAEYPVKEVVNANGTVLLGQDWHSFQRDFTAWSSGNPGIIDPTAFQTEAFPIGRLVRLRTTRKHVNHFATVTAVALPAVAGQDPAITVNPPIPPGCDVKGGWIAPLSLIRYLVQNVPAAEGERFASSTGPVAQLLRREVQPGNGVTPFAPNAGNTRAVLDYVVGFNLAFTFNSATNPGEADNYAPGVLLGDLTDNIATGTAASPVNTITLKPELARAVSIELAVRAPEQDGTLAWTQAGCAEMRCFQVFPATGAGARQGSARVRRLRADVFLPNVAFEGY